MKNVHLRSDLDATLAAVVEALAREGFVRVADGAVASPAARQVALYASDGWVGVADDRFASTDWGIVLSRSLAVPVITLAGECDHAFFSQVIVHERGERFHMSAVPADVTHGADGRHRIRPRFLAKYVPAAAAAIEEGIVVDKLGGEANMRAVGDALGIPRPLFSVHDDAERTTLVFEFRGPPLPAPRLGIKERLFGGILTQLAADLLPGASDIGGEARLGESPTSSEEEAFCGDEHRMVCSFKLIGGESVRGLVVRVTGSGFTLFDLPTMTAELQGGSVFTAIAELATDGRTRIFRFPEVELRHGPSLGLERLPLAERVRQSMQRLQSAHAFENPAEVVVRMAGRTTHEGKGTFIVTGTIENGASATSEITVRVKPAVRFPILPAGCSPKAHDAESYASRDIAVGWVGFDCPWSEARDLVVSIAEPSMRALLEASGEKTLAAHVTRSGGEELEFSDAKAAWTKLLAELERGADVTLRGIRDPFDGPTLAVVHQPDGPNLFAGVLPVRERRKPFIEITWSCPRPRAQADRDLLADMADFVLTHAGASAAHVGGVATTSRYQPIGGFESVYESLAGTRLVTYDVRWLRTHARAPGFRVLVPAAATSMLRPSDGVTARPLAHGILLASSALDPFVYATKDAEAMERAVVEAVGTPEEVARFE